jgi:transcription antitermination factor NusG
MLSIHSALSPRQQVSTCCSSSPEVTDFPRFLHPTRESGAAKGSAWLQSFVLVYGNTSLSEDGEALSSGHSSSAISNPVLTEAPAPEALPRWFAAYTTPRHEKAVVRQLDARHVESFLPLYSSVRQRVNGCKVKVEQPLFPSYVFVNIRRRESAKVLQVPGILSIVSAGREPAPLPTPEVESLRAGLPQHRFEPHAYLVAGEQVRVISGSFAGMIGILLRKKNQFRVVLTLALIRQSVAVEVGVEQVEPIRH